MARNRLHYFKDAQESIAAASRMIAPTDAATDIQVLRDAARQAQQAVTNLHMLIGVLDSEIETPLQPPAKSQESEKTRWKQT